MLEYDDIFAGADKESVMAFGACIEAPRPSTMTRSSEIRDLFAACVSCGSEPSGVETPSKDAESEVVGLTIRSVGISGFRTGPCASSEGFSATMVTLGGSSIGADESVEGTSSGANLGPLSVKLSLLRALGYGGLRIGVAAAHDFSGVTDGALTGFAGREGCNGFLGGALMVGVAVSFADDVLASESTGLTTGVAASSIRASFVGGTPFDGEGIASSTTDSCFSNAEGAVSTSFLRGLFGIEVDKMSGNGRKPPTMMGEIGSSDLFVVAPNVAVLTPQSFKSGKLSSSSPAQSIWLPGVDGLLSIATALTRSTSASISLRMSKR